MLVICNVSISEPCLKVLLCPVCCPTLSAALFSSFTISAGELKPMCHVYSFLDLITNGLFVTVALHTVTIRSISQPPMEETGEGHLQSVEGSHGASPGRDSVLGRSIKDPPKMYSD